MLSFFFCYHRDFLFLPNRTQVKCLQGASQVVLVVKNLLANAGDVRDGSSTPGSGRAPGGGHGNPLQYSCLENPMGRGAWWATYSPWGHKESRLKQLSMHMLYKWNHKA